MNFFKRAMLSVSRRKGKSIILFAVIFVLGNVMAGAISIEQGTKGVEETIKKQLGATATITYDYSKMDQAGPDDNKEPISPTSKNYKEIGDLEEVNYYDYSLGDMAITKNFKMVQSKDESIQMGSPDENYLTLKGVNYPDIIDVKNKQISMTDGRVFSDEDIEKEKAVAVISEEVAKENNLKVGDKMVLDEIIQDYSQMSRDEAEKKGQEVKKDFQIEVIGTFKVEQVERKVENKKDDNGMDDFNLLTKTNTIYLSNNYLAAMRKETTSLAYDNFPDNYTDDDGNKPSKEEVLKSSDGDEGLSATYVLKQPEMIEDFRTQATKILTENKLTDYKVLASSDQYDSVAGPVKGMSKIANLVLIVSILASILIITLVVILFLRDRKHELGVYLSLGETRTKVIGQIVVEVLAVSLLAITISVFSGNMLAKSFSNTLMETQTTDNMDGEFDWEFQQLSSNSVTEDDVIDAYEISLTPTYVALFYVVGLGVILVSTVAPLVYIMRLNPKKIMM